MISLAYGRRVQPPFLQSSYELADAPFIDQTTFLSLVTPLWFSFIWFSHSLGPWQELASSWQTDPGVDTSLTQCLQSFVSFLSLHWSPCISTLSNFHIFIELSEIEDIPSHANFEMVMLAW